MRADSGGEPTPSPPIHLRVTRDGTTIRFPIPRRLLGDPTAPRFQAAGGGEGGAPAGNGDLAPDTGTYEYTLTG